MKEYYIEWETDYCDDFPERRGDTVVVADSEQEAVQKFYKLKIPKAIIINIQERNSEDVK